MKPILTALVGGVGVGIVGFSLAGTFLGMMSTPEEIIGQATLYMKIYFAGLPSMMVYNFASAVMRSVGDTRHPLMFLVTGGVVNVGLNLFFVLVMKMDVSGVATATVISQTISAALSVIHLMRIDGPHKLYIKKLRIHKIRFITMP